MGFRVFLEVGHGGSDPGAVKYVREKDANLVIGLEMRDQLVAAGVEVGMSRTVDENDTIYEAIREANEFGPMDLAVSIHNNAGRGDGFEVFVQTNKYAAKSRAAAQAIEAEVKAIGQQSRGIKTKVYGWTYSVNAPSVRLEGFFVDNWNDAEDFDTEEEQRALARAFARGVLKYLGINPDVKPEPVETVKETYTVTASGQFDSESAAKTALEKILALGFTGSIATGTPTSTVQTKEIKENSTVRVKRGALYYNGQTPKAFVYDRNHKVHSITGGDRVVITYNGTIIGAVRKADLVLVE